MCTHAVFWHFKKHKCYPSTNLVNFKQDLLNSYLLKIDLTEISLNELTNKCNYELLHLLNKHSSLLIKKPYKNKKDKWFDSELTNLLKHCRKTERKWRKTQSVIHKAEYKYFQKLYTQTIQKKRQEFYSNSITQAKGNLRILFSKIRKLLGDKSNTLPDENDNFICATKFQHFFKDKIIKIRKNIDEERTNQRKQL